MAIKELQETKYVWVAWTNTELTEGRGHSIPKAVCDCEATAIRLGKKGSVMGSDCRVSKTEIVKYNNNWLIPGVIQPATKADEKKQMILDAKSEVRDRAIKAGLSEDDIAMLGG